MNQFEKARQKFKPNKIKYLLIAETPPKLGSDRFFYFENVEKQDSLFLETMKLLYPSETKLLKPKEIRKRKKEFLEKFKNDGFYLIDSLDQPFDNNYSTSQKVKLIKNGQQALAEKIQNLLYEQTKVILIAVPVFKANFQFLNNQKIPIINEEAIDFPGSGGQKKYREKMNRILK
jgi:ABC-type transport system substrate-binding protein